MYWRKISPIERRRPRRVRCRLELEATWQGLELLAGQKREARRSGGSTRDRCGLDRPLPTRISKMSAALSLQRAGGKKTPAGEDRQALPARELVRAQPVQMTNEQ